MVIVPDNLKAAVTRSARNKPVINEEFTAFAEHYGCTVYPARVRHPKGKALVENAVKLLYRSVYADIEGVVFNSLELVVASACATQLRQYGYQEIRQILERGDDADFLSKADVDDEVPVTSTHKNIRGAAYFAKSKHLNKNNNGNK